MTGPLTDEELVAMPPKARKNSDVIQLYRSHDFLTAYAKHTDQRVTENGYRAAVGADEQNWDLHGELQRDFLISQGLRPEHRLLEIGCGTGRLARKIVPYLDAEHYVGVDISTGAIAAALSLSKSEGWNTKHPEFIDGLVGDIGLFDFIWAFSVFIHLPISVMGDVMKLVSMRMRGPDSKFLFSYVPEKVPLRSGVKQFRKTLEEHRLAAASAGLTWKEVPDWSKNILGDEPRWAGHQRVALAKLK